MKSVDRASAVLEALASQGMPLGIGEIASITSVPPATVHRILAALGRRGLVAHNRRTRRYSIGPAIVSMAHQFFRSDAIVALAHPYLNDVRNKTHESAFLTELVGGDAVCVATAESPRPVSFYMRVGQRMPYHAAASARAILAFQTDAEIDAALAREALHPYTSATPTTTLEVRAELERVRSDGHATCHEEMEIGVGAIAVPIWNGAGDVVASLTAVAPASRFNGERRDAVLMVLNAASAGLSRELGLQLITGRTSHKEST